MSEQPSEDDSRTVTPEFTGEQAEALLTYTETSFAADDNDDEFSRKIAGAIEELERAISDSKT